MLRSTLAAPGPSLARPLALALGLWLLVGTACTPADSRAEGGPDETLPAEPVGVDEKAHEGEEEIELAVPMAHLQRHSAKLGYAIAGENAPLADFYLVEVEEVLEELQEVETYEGMPIAETERVIMQPTLAPLREAVHAADWPAARTAYETLIGGCNRCHAATEHEYLVIEPVGLDGRPAPWNQRFTVD